LNVLVVDDEPLARRRLIRLLTRLPDVEVAGEAGNGEEALERIRDLDPDVVLLDIRMPGMDGLQLVVENRELPPIIFTTAYDQYAVQAFEANAVDYLLKPVQADRLGAALEKVRKIRSSLDAGRLNTLLEQLVESRDSGGTPRVTARSGKTIRVFDAGEISRFHASDRYTVFRHDGTEYVLDDSLNALEERLAHSGFARVHRSELVNLNHVKALHLEEGASEVSLADGQTAPVSRRMVGELKRKLGMKENS
jgi:DNA-binding LytR/AlgR family response regulator